MFDPNIVYLILLLGLWLGVTAAYLPGTGVIELLSAAVTIGALFILASMPTNWGALLVLVVGVLGFLAMPLLNQRFALLAAGGLVLQAVGSVFLFNGLSVSLPLIALTITVALIYHRFALLPSLTASHRMPVVQRDDLLIGEVGRVVKPLDPVGTVHVQGELWSARSDEPVAAGEAVTVIAREGLALYVEAVKHKREEHQTNGHKAFEEA